MRWLLGVALASVCASAFGDKPSILSCRRSLVQPFAPPLSPRELRNVQEKVRASALPDALFQAAWDTGAERTRADVTGFVKGQIARGVYLDKRDSHGRTALMHAALSGNELLADELWRRGARLDLLDDQSQGAADYALLVREEEDIVPNLVLYEKFLMVNGHIAPQIIPEFRSRDYLKLDRILKSGLNRDYLANVLGEALLYYIEIGDMEAIRYVLNQGADARRLFRYTGTEANPMTVATKSCNRDAVEALLEHGADLNAGGFYAHNINPVRQAIWMYASSTYDHLPVLPFLKWLLTKGADPDANQTRLAKPESLRQFVDRLYPSGPRRRRIEWLLRNHL